VKNNISDFIHAFFQEQSSKKTIYVSEKDLVLNFAFYLKQKFPEAICRFEEPYAIDYKQQTQLPHFLEFPKLSFIDLMLELNGKKYALEFKYQTALLPVKEIQEAFELKAHGAQDVLRFGFRKDIYRPEQLKAEKEIEKGFAILLSNDPLLINTDCSKPTLDQDYRFSDTNRIIGGQVFWRNKKEEPKWIKNKAFNIDLPLKPEGYDFKWNDYLVYNRGRNGTLKYGIVEVKDACY